MAAGLLGALRLIARGVCFAARSVASLARASRAAAVVMVLAVVLLVGGAVDTALTAGKIHGGVSIGDVDVSGMTAAEARDAVESRYGPSVENACVVVFANEDVASAADLESQVLQDEALAEQVSFEEAQRTKKLWRIDAASVGAALPLDSMVESALQVGRGGLGLIDRAYALVSGREIAPYVSFDDALVEEVASDIDAAVGTPRADFDIAIQDGTAQVVEGHDGMMVDRSAFEDTLCGIFLSSESSDDSPSTLVASLDYAPLRIDRAAAQQTCEAVNSLISAGATFSLGGKTLGITRETLGSWLSTRVEQKGEGYLLAPYVDSGKAASSLVALVNADIVGQSASVGFQVDGDEVMVVPRGEIAIPLLDEAIASLDGGLFDAYRNDGQVASSVPDRIDIEVRRTSEPLSFDEALRLGVVSAISSYTTQYSDASSASNRNSNIHRAADLLDDSVASSGGGTWSFYDTAGKCDAEAGFLPAGAISENDYVQEVGGGICQVATTVFNAVYEAGYPVVRRSNHSLYIASYPAGRDAAVSWPDLDLVWRNDTDSDVLLKTAYTDSSITVTLYGVSPRYVVTTQTGAWEEGEKHKTKTEVDETLAPGTSYVKTAGTDGMKITVVRTVKTAGGSIVSQDEFTSVYSPITEVIAKAPDVKDSDVIKSQADDEETPSA